MLVLVGADYHVTTVEKLRRHKLGNKYFTCWRAACSCKHSPDTVYRWEWDAVVKAEVHARLWHGAEPDRGKWRNPNVEVA